MCMLNILNSVSIFLVVYVFAWRVFQTIGKQLGEYQGVQFFESLGASFGSCKLSQTCPKILSAPWFNVFQYVSSSVKIIEYIVYMFLVWDVANICQHIYPF
jgi:hypothetical protein